MTSQEILLALRQRHAGRQWAFFPELRTGTGYDSYSRRDAEPHEQRIDAFVINCWPSKGNTAVAYEVKVSRGDFLRELASPEKRRFAEQVSSHCYFAVPFGTIKSAEIPDPWGCITVHDGVARIIKQAVVRTLVPWPFWFIASIARRIAKQEESAEANHDRPLARRG